MLCAEKIIDEWGFAPPERGGIASSAKAQPRPNDERPAHRAERDTGGTRCPISDHRLAHRAGPIDLTNEEHVAYAAI
jgi:hypothetical protein